MMIKGGVNFNKSIFSEIFVAEIMTKNELVSQNRYFLRVVTIYSEIKFLLYFIENERRQSFSWQNVHSTLFHSRHENPIRHFQSYILLTQY